MLKRRVVAGELVRAACARHRRDLREGKRRGLYFDRAAAEHALNFFRFLRHWKGAFGGQIFELAPWQAFIVWCLFGWRRADGTRRFRLAYIEIARKNGKTTFGAGIALYCLLADREPGAEVYSAATKKDQARIVFNDAKRMVLQSPPLRRRLNVLKSNLSNELAGSKFEPLGADEDTLDGLNVHCAVVDEIHRHRTAAVWEAITTATGARRQPLVVGITTAGFDRKSLCYELHSHADQVVRGVLADDAFFAFVANPDKRDDWTDPRTWAKGNPNLGISVTLEALAEEVNRAKASPGRQNAIRRLRLNEWTESVSKWLADDAWEACTGERMPAELELAHRGDPLYLGLDLASTTDLAAVVGVFPPEDPKSGTFDVLARFFVPEENVRERVRRDRVPYDDWIRDGWLIATPGNVIDFDFIEEEIKRLGKLYPVREIPFDRWGAVRVSSHLEGEGFRMVQFGQGFASMSGPTKELEALVKAKRLRHGGHPVLRWMASNLVVETDAAGNVKPSKAKSSEKIDGMVALVMALARAIRREDDDDEDSVYEEQGIRWV